jgi:hypothetical protein
MPRCTCSRLPPLNRLNDGPPLAGVGATALYVYCTAARDASAQARVPPEAALPRVLPEYPEKPHHPRVLPEYPEKPHDPRVLPEYPEYVHYPRVLPEYPEHLERICRRLGRPRPLQPLLGRHEPMQRQPGWLPTSVCLPPGLAPAAFARNSFVSGAHGARRVLKADRRSRARGGGR